MNDIIDRIKKRRCELEMSYQDLAYKTGLSKSTLQRYETGSIKNMPIDKLEVLANALKVSPGYLMGWEEKSIPNKQVEKNIITLSNKEETLLHNFNKLNDIGKNEAIKRVEELTYISKYSNSNNIKVDEDSSYLNPVAAHDDNLTSEEKNRMDEIILKKLKELGKL